MAGTALKTRWKSTVTADLLTVLQNGGELRARHSPFESTEEGLIDFRGLAIPEGSRITSFHFVKCDLSQAEFRGAWIEHCVFDRVRFDRADLSDISDQGNSFSHCSFSGTKFVGAGLGYKGSVFKGSRFEKANFRNTVFIRAEMDDCEFTDCNLKGVDFNASSFVDCSFAGKLEDVWFRGGFALPSDGAEWGQPRKNHMKDVSFRNATLSWVTFSNQCDLSTVIPPSSGRYRLYSSWKERVERLVPIVETWSPSEKREGEIFLSAHMAHAQDQDWMLLNCDEIEERYGHVVGRRIVATLDGIAGNAVG